MAAGASPLGRGPTVALAVGGGAVPVDPLDALVAGAGAGIPVLIGSTSEEYRLWLVPSGALEKIGRSTLTLARIAARVPARIIRAHRARRPEATPGEVLGEVVSDMLLRGPHDAVRGQPDRRRSADLGVRVPVAEPSSTGWARRTRWSSASCSTASRLPMPIALGGPGAPQKLADAMHRAWVAFVIDGDPGWERWSTRRPVQAFDADGGHIDYAPRADELAGLPSR